MDSENKGMPNIENDVERMITKLGAIAGGDLRYVKDDEYDNSELVQGINTVLDTFMHRNNHFLMRINDAMIKIADNSCVKVMLDEMNSQSDSINVLKSAREDFVEEMINTNEEVSMCLAMSKQVRRLVDSYTNDYKSKADSLRCLIDSGFFNENQLEVMNGLLQSMDETSEDIDIAAEKAKIVGKSISRIYKATEEQMEKFHTLLGAVESTVESYDELFADSISVGHHLYQISRDIDNARNDMYRQNSWPLFHDKLKVFIVDHLTLTWRLYSNIVEYESLRITQLNNPDKCKFGLWFHNEIDRGSDISRTEEFQAVVDAHYELHEHAVASFLNKESFKVDMALEEFRNTLMAFEKMSMAMDNLHAKLNELGIYDETEVWKFVE